MSEAMIREVARLLRDRNALDSQLAALIDRPPSIGHLGEWIAQQVLGVDLVTSAANRAWDGHLTEPDHLAGRTVNVKFYGRREGLLDLIDNDGPDFYLVLTGPPGAAATSRGQARPAVVDAVYLFDAEGVLHALRQTGVKIGVASSVRKHLWEAAEIHPRQNSPHWCLTASQHEQLRLFGSG